jgi:hypothetical protein
MKEPCEPAADRTVSPARNRRTTGAVAVLTLLAILLPFWSGFDVPGGAMDEGMLLVYPELMLQGKLPYRDFETLYGPGNLWMLAAAYAIFGTGIDVERCVGLLYRLVVAGGIFFLLQRWSLFGAVIGTVLASSFLFLSRLPAFAWFGGVGFALWSIVLLAGRPEPRRAMGAGVLAGAALLFRVDLGLAVLASAVPLLLALTPRLRWFYAAGLIAALLPLTGLALLAGPSAMLENIFVYPVFVSNAGRRLPLSAATNDLSFLLLMHLVACVCNLLAGGLACYRDRHSTSARLLLAAALLATGLTHQAVQRIDEIHVFFAIFLSLALLPIGLAVLCRRGEAGAIPAKWMLPAAGAVVAVLFIRAPALPLLFIGGGLHSLDPEAPQTPSVVVRDRRFPRANLVEQAQEVADYLVRHSKPGERLFVGTADLRFTSYNDTFFYHLLPWLTPSTYFLEFNPLSANRPNSRLADDLASADWVIVNRTWDVPTEPNKSRIPGSDAPNAVIRKHFERQLIVDPYAVFRRRAALPTADLQ